MPASRGGQLPLQVAVRQHNLDRGKLREATLSYADPERSRSSSDAGQTRVERGKVWAALSEIERGRLRDVPIPRETVTDGEGPAAWIRRWATEPREEMPECEPGSCE
jgi:hypothetical protein